MDSPIANSHRRHPDNAPVAPPPTSPPAPGEASPQTMIPSAHGAFVIAPISHTPRLPAPLAQGVSLSPRIFHSAPYGHYGASSTSPSTASASAQEAQPNEPAGYPAAGVSPTNISAAHLSAQKRAYRQRRKDPSCDACRERKVKCDATETTACSECSSRNHKCQFTKETNRRMSSIKQVQDLQSQLAELKQENSHLRTKAAEDPVPRPPRDPHTGNHAPSYPNAQGVQALQNVQAPRRVPPPAMSNFDSVRKNIRSHSRGIFEVPSKLEPNRAVPSVESDFPEMPIRSDFAHLSRAYFASIHETFLVLHWPSFQNEVDQIYTARSFQGASQEWIGLFFAVLACGALYAPDTFAGSIKGASGGMVYFDIATRALAGWSRDVTVLSAKAALLLSIFATESNMKSAGSIWAASAVRIAQALGLNSEMESWPAVDGEMRRRLWWSIYVWDRITSLQSNCPMLINEDDCDVPMPSSIEDRYIQPQGFTRPRICHPPFTGFLATIQVARLFPQLYQTLKSSSLPLPLLQSHDEKFQSTLMLFPETYQLTSDAYLEPAALSPIMTLQMARFCLYRRNLSPVCPPADRSDALRRCMSVAQDTAKYISRTLHDPSGKQESDKSWHARINQIVSHTLCLHLWRCILMLCFRADYEAALMCLHVCTAIGEGRKINIACGKNLAFFLERLMERARSSNGGHQLEHDEEMLAYASGDLQGSLEHSWVWAGSSESAPSPHMSPRAGNHPHGTDEPMQGTHLPLRPSTASSENGTRDWEGWVRVEQMVHQLMEEHRARLAQPPSYYPPPHNPVKRVQLAAEIPRSPTKSPSQSSTSRISIANII